MAISSPIDTQEHAAIIANGTGADLVPTSKYDTAEIQTRIVPNRLGTQQERISRLSPKIGAVERAALSEP